MVGGTALGGSDAGDATIARIMQQAGLPDSKRPCLLCHHLSAWNAVLWVRWLADDAPPFHDDLYLCYPARAAPGALALSGAWAAPPRSLHPSLPASLHSPTSQRAPTPGDPRGGGEFDPGGARGANPNNLEDPAPLRCAPSSAPSSGHHPCDATTQTPRGTCAARTCSPSYASWHTHAPCRRCCRTPSGCWRPSWSRASSRCRRSSPLAQARRRASTPPTATSSSHTVRPEPQPPMKSNHVA